MRVGQMQTTEWSLQDAKNRFSAVVEAAERGDPQLVTKRGRAAVVVISVQDYARFKELESKGAPSFVDHLLAMPQDGEEFERVEIEPRDPGL